MFIIRVKDFIIIIMKISHLLTNSLLIAIDSGKITVRMLSIFFKSFHNLQLLLNPKF